MTFLSRLTLLATLLASTCLHAEPLFFTPCSDAAAPGSLCSGLNVPGSYDGQGRAVGDADATHVFVRKFAADVPAGKPAKGIFMGAAYGKLAYTGKCLRWHKRRTMRRRWTS